MGPVRSRRKNCTTVVHRCSRRQRLSAPDTPFSAADRQNSASRPRLIAYKARVRRHSSYSSLRKKIALGRVPAARQPCFSESFRASGSAAEDTALPSRMQLVYLAGEEQQAEGALVALVGLTAAVEPTVGPEQKLLRQYLMPEACTAGVRRSSSKWDATR